MAKEKKFSVPQHTAGDTVHTVVRAIFSTIPGGAELFNSSIIPPLEKRRDEWMEEVGETLRQWESEGVNIERLKDNPLFLDTVLHATYIALRNHQAEKRKALKNLIKGFAQPEPPEETFIQIALNLIDTLTLSHVSILQLLANPSHWEEKNKTKFPTQEFPADIYTLIKTAFPDLDEGLYENIVRDLYSKGLLKTEPPLKSGEAGVTAVRSRMMESHATIMGVRFLALFD